MVRLASRLKRLPPYMFASLDQARMRAREQGLEVISMGGGKVRLGIAADPGISIYLEEVQAAIDDEKQAAA